MIRSSHTYGTQARAGPAEAFGHTQPGGLASGSNSAGQGLRDKKRGRAAAAVNSTGNFSGTIGD